MGKSGRRYSAQFKEEAVRSAIHSDRPLASIARGLGISPRALRRWKRDFEVAREAATRAERDGSDRSTDPAADRRYSADFKERALRIVEEDRRPVAEVARELGVTPGTLLRWRLTVAGDRAEPLRTRPVTRAAEKDGAGAEDPNWSDPGEEVDRVQGDARGDDEESVTDVPDDRGPSSAPIPVSHPTAHPSVPQQSPRPPEPLPRQRYPGVTPTVDSDDWPPQKQKDAVGLSELLEVLRRRVWLVTAATIACTAGAVFLALRETPIYRASAVLRLGATGREAITQGFETPAREEDRYVNPLLSQTQLLRSRSLIGAVVDSVGFRLQPDYSDFGPRLVESVRVAPDVVPDTIWLDFDAAGVTVRTRRIAARADYGEPVVLAGLQLTIPGPSGAEQATWTVVSQESAVDRLLDRLRISPRVETNIIDVSFLHPDPATAQFVVNTLVTLYQDFEAEFAQERSRRRRVFLEEQVAQTDSSLESARSALRSFQSSGQTYDARQELSSQQQNRMVLDIRRGELDADRRMYEGLLDRLASTSGEERWEVLRTLVAAPGIAENTAVSRIHDQLMRQRAVLDSLTTGAFGSAGTNPDVQRQQELIATSERELTGAIRSHVASLDARAAALGELAERNSEELSGLPYQLAEEARLQQIVESYQNVSDQVREELQRARIAEAATVGETDIIDLAALPYEPEPGTRVFKVGVGLLLGLTLGFGMALLQERGNRAVQTRTELEEAFHVPVLGVIPKATGTDLAELGQWLSTNGTSVEGGGRGGGPAGRSGSQAMEAFRLLRTSFLFARWATDARIVVVTSAAPREGKTFASANLAAAFAEEGTRVLLVDSDLWRGRIHEILDVPQSPGLADVLAGTSPVSDAIRHTGLATLDFLPRGTWRSDPSSLARGTALSEVLTRLGQEYDVLLVDAAPVLAAGSAPVLPAVADGVLLMVRAGQTDRDALREALRTLRTVGARLLGVVLNDPEDLSAWAERRYYSRYEYASESPEAGSSV